MKRRAMIARPRSRSDLSPVHSSNARTLPDADRAFFGARLGHDFSHVRIHADAQAGAAAEALGARAFAEGDDVVFAAGRYQPDTPQGRRLLAHELVHVAQQARGGSGTSQPEARATTAARRASRGESVSPDAQGGATPGLYRDADDEKKKIDDAPASNFASVSPSAAGGLQPPSVLQPPGLTPSMQLQPPTLFSLQGAPGPLVPPYKLMTNAEILAPFSAYGVSPSKAGFDIHGDWATAFWTFRNYMPEGLAATSANIFLTSAYQAHLALDQPSIFDKSDRDFKAAHPEDKRIPPIPLVSSGTLTKLYEALSGKKNTNAFYF